MTRSPASTSEPGDSSLTLKLRELLEELDSPLAEPLTYDDIQSWEPGCVEFFRSIGWLKEIERATWLRLLECRRDESVEPHWEPDDKHGVIGIYCCGDEHCSGIHYIEPARMRQFKPDLRAVAASLAAELDAQIMEEIVPDRLILVGSSCRNDEYREIFLGRGLRWDDVGITLKDAQRFWNSPAPALLAPHRIPDPELWRSCKPAVLPVKDLIQVKNNRIVADLTAAFLMPVAPTPDYSTWYRVTEVAQMLVADYSCDDLEKAKARVSMAASRGFIEDNGKKGAARRLNPIHTKAWLLDQRNKASDAADSL